RRVARESVRVPRRRMRGALHRRMTGFLTYPEPPGDTRSGDPRDRRRHEPGSAEGYNRAVPDATCRIIPLGGLGEVGKNMTVYEVGGEAIVVDAGLAFPRDEHLGVDLLLPDFSYLRDRGAPVRAVLLTHAHEDHVGALPYLLREIPVQEVWATRLTLG